ncbi:class I adenylate-forming enzyme family protein [Leucobacter sp. HY1908]
MPITGTILATATQHPARVALAGSHAGERLTYAQLVADSAKLFAAVDALHRAQQRPPTPAPETVGIPITAVSVDSAFLAARIVAGLAGFRSVSAVIDPRWPLAHRIGVITGTGTGLVISADTELATALAARGWGGTVISPAAFERHVAAADPHHVAGPAVRDAAEAFLLLFSSGTTSNPKAFVKTRAQYRANVAVSAAHLEPLPGVSTLAPGPVSYSLTLYAVIECLATAGSVHLADRFDPFALAARVAREGITRVVSVPAIVQGIAAAAQRGAGPRGAGLERLSLVVTGGANLPAHIRDALARALPGTRLISYYGAAEIGFIGDSRDGDGTRVRLYDGIEASVRDARGNELPAGEPGTLWIRAAACSDGYVARTSNEQLRGGDGWATVHDQARMIDGQLELLGRAGDIAITGGHKVSLIEVERAFAGLPQGAVAVALPHATLGSVIGLVVEGDAGQVPSRARLREIATAQLAPQYVPSRWYRLDELPRTVGGKVRRIEATELAATGRAERL